MTPKIGYHLWMAPYGDSHEKLRDIHSKKFYNRMFSFFSECPPTLSGKRRFYCPSVNDRDESICVTSEQICNDENDCPNGQDEDELMCFYHRPVSFCKPY